ncbi:hypothetical protein ASF08_22550 [Methylobacterium sp. Leaf85]|nr:hypothetical protein ASF08_22550 [Methylobacterium sp. Leaf85]
MDYVGSNRRSADYRAKKLMEQGWTCRDCDNREAIARADASGLPPLEGTEKQVGWAATIREGVIARLDRTMPVALQNVGSTCTTILGREVEDLIYLIRNAGEPSVREAAEIFRNETEATFWIEGRSMGLANSLAAIIRRLADEAHAHTPESKAAVAAEQEAMAEATLRPATPVSETIAELTYREGILYARYDERSDKFNDTVKRIGHSWDPVARAWVRRHSSLMMGQAVDRLAELAHELLAAGIVVMLHDTEARGKAIARSYDPEHRRWVSLVPTGAQQGKLRLTWGRDEDFYRAFKSLPGATYTDRRCLVPGTARDEVLDFAEAHGFRITPGAQARMEEVMAQRERGVVVDAVARPKAEPVKVKERGARPDRLAVPEQVEIDSDLVDHD